MFKSGHKLTYNSVYAITLFKIISYITKTVEYMIVFELVIFDMHIL